MKAWKELLVVVYYNGKAIITDESGHIYYISCSENEAPIGTVVGEEDVAPISELGIDERQKIEALFC